MVVDFVLQYALFFNIPGSSMAEQEAVDIKLQLYVETYR